MKNSGAVTSSEIIDEPVKDHPPTAPARTETGPGTAGRRPRPPRALDGAPGGALVQRPPAWPGAASANRSASCGLKTTRVPAGALGCPAACRRTPRAAPGGQAVHPAVAFQAVPAHLSPGRPAPGHPPTCRAGRRRKRRQPYLPTGCRCGRRRSARTALRPTASSSDLCTVP